MPFFVIVPARRNSSRLPNKPLADICGTPMLVRTLTQTAAAGAAQVIAAVDDDDVAAVAAAANFSWQMTDECDSGSVRVALAAQAKQFPNDAIVVNVQGDEPFIEPDIIANTAKLLMHSPQCVCATAARPPKNTAEFFSAAAVKVVLDANGRARYFSRAPIPHYREAPQTPPPDARIHIGIYAYTMKFLQQLPTLSPSPAEQTEQLEQLRILWHGEQIAVLDCNSDSFGIDTPEDLQKARQRAAQSAT